MALLVMQETDKVSYYFEKVSDADREGKYGALCRKQLALMETPVG
jgi:hypothetical protein